MNVGVVLNKNALCLKRIRERYPERVGEEQWQTHDLEPLTLPLYCYLPV